jgi:BMFP domain-containing protein YqiC
MGMPVTAKLSRHFYEQLGDEIANELVDWFNSVDATYRSDLDRLNELNFARFDAKLEQRLAQLEMKLNTEWGKRFTHIEARIEKVRSDLIKWMFIFWTGTVLALAGFFLAYLKTR